MNKMNKQDKLSSRYATPENNFHRSFSIAQYRCIFYTLKIFSILKKLLCICIGDRLRISNYPSKMSIKEGWAVNRHTAQYTSRGLAV